jgi:hypothetical protein
MRDGSVAATLTMPGRYLHPCLGRGSIVPARPPIRAASQASRERSAQIIARRRPGVAKYEAYCVKCRAKREFEGTEVTLKNGRRAAQGNCPVCGTKVMRILGKAS